MTSLFIRRRNAGMTLIEVIIVCAVGALLAGVAIPIYANGVMSSNRAKCLSNMRQIGMAALLYAADNGGVLPMTSHSTGDSRFKFNGEWVSTIEYSWIYVLADYLGKLDEIRICPADEKARQKQIRALKATSYVLNDAVFDSDKYRRLSGIPSPSRTAIMFINNRPISKTWDHAHCEQWTSWAALCADIAPDRHRTGAHAADRTKGSANYLYADGHVKNIMASELKQMLENGETPWLPGTQ